MDEEALANEFWMMAIIMRPGARNSIKGIPFMLPRSFPIASVKMARKTKVVITGARIVWI